MMEARDTVEVRALSPGRFTILVVALPSGELRIVYDETGYDPARSKPATEEWLRENAIGRHGFVPVSPPETVEVASLPEFARRMREG